MLRGSFVAFLIAILPHLTAQVVDTATLHGTVTYADTGKPAHGINLWLEPAQHPRYPQPDPKTGDYEIRDSDSRPTRYAAKVGADGAFDVTGLPAGDYIVHTYAPSIPLAGWHCIPGLQYDPHGHRSAAAAEGR